MMLLLLCSCAVPAPLAPLPTTAEFAVDYRGTISPSPGDERGVEQAPDGTEPPADADVRIAAWLLDVPLAVARELLPGLLPPATAPSARGLRLAAAGMPQALAALREVPEAALIGAPELLCADNRQARMQVQAQQAYVRGFRVVPGQQEFIADPVVGQVQAGYILTFVPTLLPDRKGVRLALDFEFRDLVSPLPVVGMPFAQSDLQLHVPVEMRQELRCQPDLGARDAFVLAAKSGRAGHVLLTFVEVEVVELGVALR
jgi:hypothetical protein